MKGSGSRIYELNRDNKFLRDVRDRIEAMWVQYKPLCRDPGFQRKAMQQFNACVWQMYVACVLLDYGHQLEPSGDDAPDIRLRRPDGDILWIEVTTAEPGESNNRAGREITHEISEHSAMCHLDGDKVVLRLMKAITAKTAHRSRFLERGRMNPGDPYLIAINSAEIIDSDLDDGLPNIVRSVYPIGPLQFVMPVRTGDAAEVPPPPSVRYGYRAAVPIAWKNKEAPSTGFIDDTLAYVSGLMWSPQGIWNIAREPGRDVVTVLNSRALNPVEHDLFQFGEVFYPHNGALHRHNWRTPLD